MPKVTIILTSFNHDKYICHAIDSIISQTFSDFELLILDDASTDNSWWLINQYNDSRIKTFRSDVTGEVVWRTNELISEVAKGEYIAIHHSDDIWENTKLEKQVDILNRVPSVSAVFTNASAITEDGSLLADQSNFYFSVFDQPNRSRYEWLRFFFLIGNALCHPSALIRKESLAECGNYRPWFRQLDDFDLWVRLTLKSEIHVIPEKLTRFRVRLSIDEVQVSGNYKETRIRSAYELLLVLDNYKHIQTFDDLYAIFPEARKYHRTDNTDLSFVLGQTMLELATVPMARLFALELVRDAVTDPVRGARIYSTYGFGAAELIDLTGRYDVFSLEELSVLRAALTKSEAQTHELQTIKPSADVELQSLSFSQIQHSSLANQLEMMRDAWASTHKENLNCLLTTEPQPDNENETIEIHKIYVFALAAQRVQQDILERFTGNKQLPMLIKGKKYSIEIYVFNSVVDLLRAAASQQEGYIALSSRPDLIWDQHLLDRMVVEIGEINDAGRRWVCISADGADHTGKTYVSAHFNGEPSLSPDRGRRLIVQTGGTLCIINIKECRSVGILVPALTNINDYINANILLGYSHRIASHFTSLIYPCVAGIRNLCFLSLEDFVFSINNKLSSHVINNANVFANSPEPQFLLGAWVNETQGTLLVRHKLSFVVRTLFRRQHLLRRCLISIEYIRFRLGFQVEIIIATDIDKELATQEVEGLRNEFPNLIFVTAHANNESGCSRVRNLLAGLKESTGSRVAIIDDDDYYAPQAVDSFKQACQYGGDTMVVFGTQIVTEKWTLASKKWHRELVSYGHIYCADKWEDTLLGSNSIPLCGVIHPGWFVREVAQQYRYNYDLSEDFIFHLLCFTHPKRPSVQKIEGIFAYQSHRHGDDNVSTVEDRAGWVSDTGNGLFQFLFEQNQNIDRVTRASNTLDTSDMTRRIEFLEAELATTRRDWALAQAALVATMTANTADTANTVEVGKIRKLVRLAALRIKHRS